MTRPFVLARVEEPCNFAAFGINPGDVWPFERIAVEACQTKIVVPGASAVAYGDYVVNFER